MLSLGGLQLVRQGSSLLDLRLKQELRLHCAPFCFSRCYREATKSTPRPESRKQSWMSMRCMSTRSPSATVATWTFACAELSLRSTTIVHSRCHPRFAPNASPPPQSAPAQLPTHQLPLRHTSTHALPQPPHPTHPALPPARAPRAVR